jgi:acyl-coenzyme A synthetase/AMP-(fatty) acid ligase
MRRPKGHLDFGSNNSTMSSMIIDRLYEWAHIQPNKTALIHNATAISYATFARIIERTRKFLEGQQLPQGSTAALVIFNLANCWVANIALRAIGLNTIAVTSTLQAQQLQIRDLSCFVLIEGGEVDPHDLAMPASANARLIVVPRAIYADIHQDDLPAPLGMNSLYGGHILYTSGTTGSYKQIFMSSDLEDRRNSRRADVLSVDTDTIFNGLFFRLWTGAGYKQPLAVWHRGACIVFDQSKNWPNNLFRFGITRVFLLPYHVRALFASRSALFQNNTKLNDCVISVSGGFLPSEFAERITRELTPKLLINYSATELIDVPLQTWYENKDDLVWLKIVNDCKVEIVDELGRECLPYQEGEIRIARKEIDASAYIQNDDDSRRVFRDGYFYPGDMAIKRADGRIRILGRVEDVINLHGAKVAVTPIEQDLQRYLEADEVCLFGHINDLGQEELIVAIQSSSAPPQEKLDHIRKRFHFFETVRFSVLRDFPRTDTGTGKVRRLSLRNRLINER